MFPPTYAVWGSYLQNVFKYLGPHKSILLENIYSDQKSFTCPSPMCITKLRLSGWSKSGSNTDVQYFHPECPDRPAAGLHAHWWPSRTTQWQRSQNNGLRILFSTGITQQASCMLPDSAVHSAASDGGFRVYLPPWWRTALGSVCEETFLKDTMKTIAVKQCFKTNYFTLPSCHTRRGTGALG